MEDSCAAVGRCGYGEEWRGRLLCMPYNAGEREILQPIREKKVMNARGGS